jgi:two-component system, cell cycle sensor histidine kinase and response regulator CckA
MVFSNRTTSDGTVSLREHSSGSPDQILRISSDGSFTELGPKKRSGFTCTCSHPLLVDDTSAADTIVRETSAQRARALDTGVPQTITLKDLSGNPPGEQTVVLVPCPEDEVVALIHHVSDLNKMDERLLKMQALATVGSLASGLAHDLGNLLTPILAYWQMADGVRETVDAHEVRSAAEQSAALCRRLLALFRDQSAPPDSLDLGEVVEGMAFLLRSLAGTTVQVETSSQPALGSVMAIRGRIENIILNLVINARDSMPEGGTITLQTSDVAVPDGSSPLSHGPPAGDYVLLEVTDTGTGIDDEVSAFIFDPLFTTKAAESGTGLGLYLCSSAVAQSGGHIAVDSRHGAGTTFSVYLPRIAETSTGGVDIRSNGGETVLLVEDEAIVRDVAAAILRESGYRVLEASEGSEAIALVDEHGARGIQLLLTDLIMPRMSGAELARQLRRKLPSIQVLYTSGYSDAALAKVLARDPGAMFIQKPFTPSDLTKHVRMALGS